MWQREAAGALTSSSVRDVTYGAESGIVDCGCSDRMSPVSDVTTGTAAGAEFQLREVEEQLDNIFTPTPIELLKVTPEFIRVLRYVTLHHRGDRVRLCLCAMCLPVSLSARKHISGTTRPIFDKFLPARRYPKFDEDRACSSGDSAHCPVLCRATLWLRARYYAVARCLSVRPSPSQAGYRIEADGRIEVVFCMVAFFHLF